MKVERVEAKEAIIRFSPDELLLLNNALNEVCNGLDLDEFSTRMGAELEDVEKLLQQIGEAIDTMNPTS